MSAQLQQLLEQQLPQPGEAAWAVRMPDAAVGQETFGDWFSADQVAQVLARLTQAVENLNRHQFEPTRLSWVFEHARLHLAVRADGACLMLIVENRQDVPQTEIGQLLDSFLTLPEM